MSDVLLAIGLGAGVPCIVGFAVVAILSLRALRRDADFDAEMRAASFAFRLRMRPHGYHPHVADRDSDRL